MLSIFLKAVFESCFWQDVKSVPDVFNVFLLFVHFLSSCRMADDEDGTLATPVSAFVDGGDIDGDVDAVDNMPKSKEKKSKSPRSPQSQTQTRRTRQVSKRRSPRELNLW